MKIFRLTHIVVVAFVLASFAFFDGCGSKDKLETAPDGSTIVFSPEPASFAITADTCVNLNVILRYPDGTPFPHGVVIISGSFAAPRNVAGDSPRYQFYSGPQCNLPGGTGVPVDSGFQGQTDVKGVYSFSALVPALVTITTSTGLTYQQDNAFSDTLVARSGTAVGTANFQLQ